MRKQKKKKDKKWNRAAKSLNNFARKTISQRKLVRKDSHSQGAQTDNRINNLLHKFPFSLPYGGFVTRSTGGWSYRSMYGLFWSEGASSGSYARDLYFDGVNVWPEYNTSKTNGFSLRCVASQVSN